MGNYLADNQDLRYYVERGIDWSELIALTELRAPGHAPDTTTEETLQNYRDMINLVGEFVANEIGPHAAQIDREGVRFENGEAIFGERLASIIEAIRSLEIHGLCLPRELGGQNASIAVFFLISEMIARADVSVMTHVSFHMAIAMAMMIFSIGEGTTKFDSKTGGISETRFAEFIEEIRTGDAWGAMDITEPNAGSDMAALRSVGEQDDNGHWFLTGQKIFLTSGHGKYHFVIARTEEANSSDDPFAGLNGLSMFLVKTYDDTPDGKKWIASLDRIEEKLGHHGSATASVTFERTPGFLIGKRGDGFKHMLTLMNNARIGVGFESIGLCECAYRMALQYARGRSSMGKTLDRHEMIADYLDEMKTDIMGLRALAVESVIHEEHVQRLGVYLNSGFCPEADREAVEKTKKRHAWRARRYTPLLKYLAAEKAVEMSQRNIQIHGGVGYTTEFGAEKLLRDAMVFPIYEGTSQIQALMVMKDTLQGAMQNPQRFAAKVAKAGLKARAGLDPVERRLAKLQALGLSSQQHLLTRTVVDKYRSLHGVPVREWPKMFLKNWDPKRDFAYARLHAERLTRQLVDVAICEVLLAQSKRHPERREILERYLERAEPRAYYLHNQIEATGDRIVRDLSGASSEGIRDAG